MALIELLAAVLVAGWLATRTWGLNYLLGTVCTAPFLLLRTPAARELGLSLHQSAESWLQWWDNRLERHYDPTRRIRTAVLSVAERAPHIVYLVGIPLIRPISVAFTAATSPLPALREVPSNWWKAVACRDLLAAPEILPGLTGSDDPLTGIREDFRYLVAPKNYPLTAINILGATGYALVLVVFGGFYLAASYPYRVSVKLSSVAWVPLLWIIPKGSPTTSVETRLRQLSHTNVARFVAGASFLFVCQFLAKWLLFSKQAEFDAMLAYLNVPSLFREIIQPGSFSRWQMASLANSVIILVSFFAADELLVLMSDKSWSPRWTKTLDLGLRASAVTRSLLSLYTTSCLVYLIAAQGREVPWPSLDDRWFPWC